MITNGGINFTGTPSSLSGASNPTCHFFLSGANTYTGDTTINRGNMVMGVGSALPSATSVVMANSTVGQNATLDMNGNNQTVAGLRTAGGAISANNTIIGSGILTVNTTTTNNAFAGQINGTVALTKQNTGSLFLNGTNASTGAVLVQGGKLGGNGSIAGAITVNTNATFAPGASVGTFTSTNNTATAATMQTNANWEVEFSHADTSVAPVAGVSNDLFLNNGAASVLTLPNGNLNFVLVGTPGTTVPYTNSVPVSYTVATFNNSTVGAGIVATGTTYSFDTTNFAPVGGAMVDSYLYSAAVVGNSLVLTITPVPEPATVLAVCAVGAGAFGLIRRRLRKGNVTELAV